MENTAWRFQPAWMAKASRLAHVLDRVLDKGIVVDSRDHLTAIAMPTPPTPSNADPMGMLTGHLAASLRELDALENGNT